MKITKLENKDTQIQTFAVFSLLRVCVLGVVRVRDEREDVRPGPGQ